MMNRWRRWFEGAEGASRPLSRGGPITEVGIDFSLRIYWMKISTEQKWTLERIHELRDKVLPVVQASEFEKNLIERRYTVEGLDERAHSGASLMALLDVLYGLEQFDDSESQKD
jgi:hypothetical protein